MITLEKRPIVTGVYLVGHATDPLKVYVGSSLDCFGRNSRHERLGLPWGIVQEMPGASPLERIHAETKVAQLWAARGFTVVSSHEGSHRRGVKGGFTPERIAKIVAKNKARKGVFKHSAASKRKMRLARLGKTPWNKGKRGAQTASPETRAKISAALLARRQTPWSL